MSKFVNHYHCEHEGRLESGQEACDWEDTSDCMNNDKCPTCNAEIEPYESEDIEDDSMPPDPEDMNEERADAARGAVVEFTRTFGEKAGGLPQNLTDLVCDMAHLCDREGLQFSAIIEGAKRGYAAETDGKGKQF